MVKCREMSTGEKITNAISHGFGFVLAITALVILVVHGRAYGTNLSMMSFVIYGTSLVLLYLSSTLYHSFPEGKVKDIFQIIDHGAIYLLIAGTYTPLALIALNGPLGWSIFGGIWVIAIGGIILKVFFINRLAILSTLLYVGMGWAILFFIGPLFRALHRRSFIFLLVGGLLYTGGIVFYAWKSMKYNHAIWHLFVLGGSTCHFFTVLFLLPR